MTLERCNRLGQGFLGLVLLAAVGLFTAAREAPRRPVLHSYAGAAPAIDGRLDRGEWADATEIQGVRDWTPEFSPVTKNKDLSLRGWVKHDSQWLYFAFEVTDDVLYGIDTDRWLPTENAQAHALTREGFPWFGDEMELLINAPGTWRGDEDSDGTAASWQMVCNLTKSRLGGIGKGGLLEGEPRSEARAWETYGQWIREGAQVAAARRIPGRPMYVIEWAIRFDRCFEVAPGRFYNPAEGDATVGLNIAVGDLDQPEDGKGNFGGFHHEQWWAGEPHTRTRKNNFGTLQLHGLKTSRKP